MAVDAGSMGSDRVPEDTTQERVVRVFVSSTFQDMQLERDALVKRTFPELRRRCRDLSRSAWA